MSLEKEDIERLKEIFVTRQECDNKMDGVEEKIGAENVRLAVIEHRLGTIAWLLMTIGSGVITILLKLFLGGS